MLNIANFAFYEATNLRSSRLSFRISLRAISKHKTLVAKDLIKSDIPVLNLSDDPINAINLMEEYKVTHLPVVETGIFIGLVSEEELMSSVQPSHGLLNNDFELQDLRVGANQHIYDVLKVAAAYDLTVIPVVDANKQFLGAITLTDLVDAFAEMQAVTEPGGVIILEMNSQDYTLSHLANIVEENGAKILSATLTTFPDSTKVELTLKINKDNLGPILQSLNRFDYQVKASYQEPEFGEDLRDRYEELMKYLNM